MVSGDGEGLVDAADVGLLDGAGVVRYSRVVPDAGRAARARSRPDAALVVTDKNRCRARHLERRCSTTSATPSRRGEKPLVDRPRRRAACRCSPASRPTR